MIDRRKEPLKASRREPGLSRLRRRFPDDAAAEKWFEQQRWGKKLEELHCGTCGSEEVRRTPKRKPSPYWCGECRRYFSAKTGSVMERSKIGYQKWAFGLHIWTASPQGVSSLKLHRDLGITQKSAYFMAQRLREIGLKIQPKPSSESIQEGAPVFQARPPLCSNN